MSLGSIPPEQLAALPIRWVGGFALAVAAPLWGALVWVLAHDPGASFGAFSAALLIPGLLGFSAIGLDMVTGMTIGRRRKPLRRSGDRSTMMDMGEVGCTSRPA